jgi:chromosome segregation ATPase
VVLSNGVRHELKRSCYSLNSQKTAVERVQTASKTGGLSANYIGSNRANPYETDVSAQRALAQQELADAKQEREEHQRCFDAADQEKKASFRDVAAVTKEVQSIQKDIGGLEDAMRNEEAIQARWKDEDADEQDQEIRALQDISGFEEEEEQIKRQIESKTDEMKGVDIAITKMKEEEQEFEAEKQVVERKRQDILRELKDAEKTLQAELEGASTRNEKIDAMRALIAKHQAKWNEAQTNLVEQTRLRTVFEDSIPGNYGWKEKGASAKNSHHFVLLCPLSCIAHNRHTHNF